MTDEAEAWSYYYKKFEGWRSSKARAAALAANRYFRTGIRAARCSRGGHAAREAAAKRARAAALKSLQAALADRVAELQADPDYGLSGAAIEAEATQKAIAAAGVVVFVAGVWVVSAGTATPVLVAGLSTYGGYMVGGAAIVAATYRRSVDSSRYGDGDMARDVAFGALTMGKSYYANSVSDYLCAQGVSASTALRVGTGTSYAWGVPSLAYDARSGALNW